jgi:hypothetical protein
MVLIKYFENKDGMSSQRCTVMEKNRVGKELGTKNFIFSK